MKNVLFDQICQKLRAHNWTTEWDLDSQSQYAYSDTGQWVGYDSLKSATLKVNKTLIFMIVDC